MRNVWRPFVTVITRMRRKRLSHGVGGFHVNAMRLSVLHDQQTADESGDFVCFDEDVSEFSEH